MPKKRKPVELLRIYDLAKVGVFLFSGISPRGSPGEATALFLLERTLPANRRYLRKVPRPVRF